MPHRLDPDDLAGAQEWGRRRAQSLMDYDGTRGQWVMDSNHMSAFQAGAALESYLGVLLDGWGNTQTRDHLSDLLDPGTGVLDKIRPWVRHSTISPLVAACSMVESHQLIWANLFEKWKNPTLDLLLLGQMETGSPGTGALAVTQSKHFIGWLAGMQKSKKEGTWKDHDKMMERAERDGFLEIAWACALAGCARQPQEYQATRNTVLLLKAFITMEEGKSTTILSRISPEHMVDIERIVSRASDLNVAEAETGAAGWAAAKRSWLHHHVQHNQRIAAKRKM